MANLLRKKSYPPNLNLEATSGILSPKHGHPGASEVPQSIQDICVELGDRSQDFRKLRSLLQSQVEAS